MKLILSWGSNGSGKTLVAWGLASLLAVRHKKNVIIISADLMSPALPVLLPTVKLGAGSSLGFLSGSKSVVNDITLAGRIHLHPGSDRIGIMGYNSGDTPVMYEPISEPAIVSLVEHLRHKSPFDYIILDGQSNTIYDQLTLYGLKSADFVLRTVTPDVKGVEFQRSQLIWLRNSGIMHPERHIKLLSPVHPFSAEKETSALLDGIDYSLLFSDEVLNKFVAGELLSGMNSLNGLKVEAVLEKLVKRTVN